MQIKSDEGTLVIDQFTCVMSVTVTRNAYVNKDTWRWLRWVYVNEDKWGHVI